MQAQEFSSPGEHMASISHSDNVSYNPPTYYGDYIPDNSTPNIIYAPRLNDTFDNFQESRGGYGSSARSYANRYNREYMDYNDRLYNSAKDYDMMMSNTAIQRQVADLKKAGLNPILAAYLGGAQYKGVSAPYLSISPGSALQAYTQYGSSMYATDVGSMTQLQVTKLKNASQEFIADFNGMITREGYINQKDLANIKISGDVLLEELSHLNDVDLQKLGFKNQKDLLYQKSVYDRSYLKLQKDLEVEKYKDISNYKYDYNSLGIGVSSEAKYIRDSLFWKTTTDIIYPATMAAGSLSGMMPSNPVGFQP